MRKTKCLFCLGFWPQVGQISDSVIHGNPSSRCYITIYENGAVYVQEVRSLYYGTNVTLPMS